MESRRFDDLARLLIRRETRRGVHAAALGGVVGLLGPKTPETAGHDAAKACKGKRGDKKKACLKKVKAHNRRHECLNDGDCADRSTSCQGGRCQTICPAAVCSGCTLCVAHLEKNAERSPLCANSLIQVAPDTCSTDADCTGDEDDVCVRVSSAPCTESPCGLCVSPNICV